MLLFCLLLYPQYVIIIPMYNVHPYFSLKNLSKKNAHYTWQNMGYSPREMSWRSSTCNGKVLILKQGQHTKSSYENLSRRLVAGSMVSFWSGGNQSQGTDWLTLLCIYGVSTVSLDNLLEKLSLTSSELKELRDHLWLLSYEILEPPTLVSSSVGQGY